MITALTIEGLDIERLRLKPGVWRMKGAEFQQGISAPGARRLLSILNERLVVVPQHGARRDRRTKIHTENLRKATRGRLLLVFRQHLQLRRGRCFAFLLRFHGVVLCPEVQMSR